MENKPIDKQHEVTLTWNNLTANVGSKFILNQVSGYCRPGQMLAIMGPSGAGKTTLLSLLASKKNPSLKIQGSVLANNTEFTAQEFYSFGVYIFQNDILHSTLTVKQTLQFIARLQIHHPEKASQRVNEMIATFELQKCQDTFVGGQMVKGISGGQKKRVCIAVEMISDPDLLILDEPTSGLDSHKVTSVVKVLRKLAIEKGKTVIFTLHQPSFLIYQQLDRLLLLDKGRTVYQGASSQMYRYLTERLKITVPLNCTLPDFFTMEISEFKQSKNNEKTKLNHENYCLYLKSQVNQQLQEARIGIKNQGIKRALSSRGFLQQFPILMRRQWVIFMRNKLKGLRLILISLLIVLTSGLIFLNAIKDNRPQDGQLIQYQQLRDYMIKAQGTIYIAVLSCIMSNVNTVALNFPLDRQIYYKESSSNKYMSISYLISKIITQVGLCMIGAIIVGVGEYLMIGYTLTIDQFLKFILTLMICCMVGNSLGFFVGTLFKEPRLASVLTPLILMPLMMFSGMYTRLDSLAPWIGWIQYISPFKYGLHALLVNEYHQETYHVIVGSFDFAFDYRKDLLIKLDFWDNIFVLIGLIFMIYTIAFVLLKKLASNLAP